jgi:ribonuclease HII
MGLGQACNLEIDTHNIWRCVQVAMARALNAALTARFSDSRGLEGIDRAYRGDKEGAETETLVLVVDGNRAIAVAEEHADATQVTCVRGDSRFVSLGLASVVAKVARDADMVRAGRLHPGYGFERHKGYGTAEHLVALRERAPMSLHRRTFLKSFV